MKMLLKIISYSALIITVIPSIMFLRGAMELDRVKMLMLAGTILWFIVTPFWMGKEAQE